MCWPIGIYSSKCVIMYIHVIANKGLQVKTVQLCADSIMIISSELFFVKLFTCRGEVIRSIETRQGR